MRRRVILDVAVVGKVGIRGILLGAVGQLVREGLRQMTSGGKASAEYDRILGEKNIDVSLQHKEIIYKEKGPQPQPCEILKVFGNKHHGNTRNWYLT